MIGGIEMKKVLAKIILAFVIFLITMNIQYQSNAYTYSSDSGIYMADSTIDPSQYKPEPQQNTKMNSIIRSITNNRSFCNCFRNCSCWISNITRFCK